MKKIVPFNNVLNFETDVCEISAISLEHKIDILEDAISGVFYITGEYKITDGQLEREKFSFELPFDIALGSTYDRNTLVVDIDDFRYEIVDRNKLKVNIDLYIDGEIVPNEEIISNQEREIMFNEKMIDDKEDDSLEEDVMVDKDEDVIEPIITSSKERIDLLDDMLDNSEEENMEEEKEVNINNVNNNNQENINILNGISNDTEYVTYRVYRIMEGDTIDKIIDKYKVSHEELEKYNDLGDIKIGDKLIIPANDK